MVFAHFPRPAGLRALLAGTFNEIVQDNCLGLAAQLAYYFLLALFPALIVLVAVLGLLPIQGIMGEWLDALSRVAPPDVLQLVRHELTAVAQGGQASLLTVGIAGALWSASTAMAAIIDTLNRAYDIDDHRPWWKTRLLAIGLTLALAVFMIVAQVLLLLGPWLTHLVSGLVGVELSAAWDIARWVLTVFLVVVALGLVYHFAPDAQSEWTWVTPGAVVATTLWILASLGFRVYVTHAGNFEAMYGTLGGVVVALLWFYLSGLAILIGAEVNAELDRESPYRAELVPRSPGERPKLGAAAAHAHARRTRPA